MYEALLRERMDAEGSEEFDRVLRGASDPEDEAVLSLAEKRDMLLNWGGDVVTD